MGFRADRALSRRGCAEYSPRLQESDEGMRCRLKFRGMVSSSNSNFVVSNIAGNDHSCFVVLQTTREHAGTIELMSQLLPDELWHRLKSSGDIPAEIVENVEMRLLLDQLFLISS